MKYHIINNSVFQNMIAEVRGIVANGKTPIVSVSDKKESRSQAQNRLMQQWFKDIANVTCNDIIYEAGRCKYRYFLPIMQYSEHEEPREAFEIIKEFEAFKGAEGYEIITNALGRSMIASTRTLKVKEFAVALTMMQEGEYMNNLTDPAMIGIDMSRWQ